MPQTSDTEHPFWHGRLEYINSTVMAAVSSMWGSHSEGNPSRRSCIRKIPTLRRLVAGILVFGLIGKLFLAWWYKRASQRLSSDSFLAYSADSLSDMLSTAGVLVATLVEYFFGWHIDGVMGVIMSLFILWTGYGIMKQAVNDILGRHRMQSCTRRSRIRSFSVRAFMVSMTHCP